MIRRDRGAAPERAVALLAEIEERPRRGVEARGEGFLVRGKIGRRREPELEIHGGLEFVHVHEAIDVMDVVVEKFLGGADGDDGFQRRGMEARHHDGIEAAPGNSHHSDRAGGPGLAREPVDDFEAVVEFLVGVFAVGRRAFAGARAANVHARGDVTAADEVRVEIPVALEAPIVFAVGQVFEDDGELRAGRRAFGHVEVHGEANAVFHGDPGLDFFHGGVGRRLGRRLRGGGRGEE